MKFGVREICNVVFRATTKHSIGNKTFEKGQPVFYLDSAKTSSMEGATTTVYAQGGRGNTRLVAWEGERTLTFTVEDALLSPISFAMLSGAGVLKGNADSDEEVHFHQTTITEADEDGIIDLTNALEPAESIDPIAPLFVMTVDEGGDIVELVQGKFQLKKDKTYDTVDGKQLMYTDDTDYRTRFKKNITANLGDTEKMIGSTLTPPTGNKSNYAYAFPYTINDSHLVTEEEVQGWNNNKDNTGDNKRFAEPVPESVIKTIKPNTGDSFQGIPQSVWYVQTVTGKRLKIEMPKAFSEPIFTGAQLYTSNSSVSGITDDQTAFYQVISGLSEQSYLYINRPTPGVVVKALDGDKKPIGDSITVSISTGLKNIVMANYFGKTINSQAPTKDSAASERETWINQYEVAKKISDAYKTYRDLLGKTLMVDYYVVKKSAGVTEIQIDASNFGGYYYVEADTLFRRQIDGKDIPANLTFPNVKIQSNFNFSMAATGDPSTFTFTMDAFPGYTYFDKSKKVLCAMQLLDDKTYETNEMKTIFPHKAAVAMEESMNDSSPNLYDEHTQNPDQAYVTI